MSDPEQPALDDWLDEVRAQPPLPAAGPDSATLVSEGRRDSDARGRQER